MFPISNSSQTIIDCFQTEADKLGVEVLLNQAVREIFKEGENFVIQTTSSSFTSPKVVVATGSNPKIWKLLEGIGHTIVPAVPSLFTFNIKDSRTIDLPGVSTNASVKVLSDRGKVLLESSGPLLITHWGMSGPAILKLSAWGARVLEPLKYRFQIEVNWLETVSAEEVIQDLKSLKSDFGKQTLLKHAQFDLPKRLWQSLLKYSGINESLTWADATRENLQNIANQLTSGVFQVDGKSTFKEEFVTAGGVDLKEVNFKTFESRVCKNLYFAGEVLNIDAITGGFNFQNAWTSGYIVSQNLFSKSKT